MNHERVGQDWLRNGQVGIWKYERRLEVQSFKSEIKRQERIFNVATNVNNYHSTVEYLNSMAVAC